MEGLFDFSLDFTRWLQATYPQLQTFFIFVSELGREQFYLAVLPIIYWCWNKSLGKHLAYVFLFTLTVNGLFKHMLRAPRPFWLDGTVQLSEEAGYGVPSGHMQLTTVIYLLLAGWLKQRWMSLLAVVMLTMMAISRIYLGMHFAHDVGVGFLLGCLTLLGYWIWQRRIAKQFGKRILGQRLLTAVMVPIVFTLIYIIIRFIIGEPNLPISQASFVAGAELESVEQVVTGISALLGAGVGFVFEKSRVRFRSDGPIWKRVTRYLLGIAITFGLWGGLRVLFAPADMLWLALSLRVVRYLLVLIWVSYYAPMVFVRLGLADAEPEPGINLSL